MTTPDTTPRPGLGTYLHEAQQMGGYTDRQLAEALGFSRPLVVTMVKAGTMKLPLSKIPQVAATLGLTQADVLVTLMREYYGQELVEAIEKVTGTRGMTEGERRVLEAYRALCAGREDEVEPKILDGRNVLALITT